VIDFALAPGVAAAAAAGHYEEVIDAYLRGLADRADADDPLEP
jgi:hypothetical protein